MKTRISAILPLLLITLGCVLAVEGFYNVVENFLSVPVDEIKLVAQIPGKKQTVATLKHTVEDDARIVLARNLFGPPPSDKKNEQYTGEVLAELQATSLDLILLGTIIGETNESRAIILEKGTKTQDIYQLGEMVQGAVLREIVRGKVVLNYNNKDEILDMAEAAKYAPKTPGAVGPAVLRQEKTLSGAGQAIPEIAPQSPQVPDAAMQPASLRPARRFNSQTPIKIIQ